MADKNKHRVRKLYGWEVEEFSSVFGNTLDTDQVRIHEFASWPDWIDRLGRSLKRMPPPGEHEHNAVTLGNHCFFPVGMPEELLAINDPMGYKHDWLVHELTHAWQYQHMGWRYLFNALFAQLKEKAKAYDFGGESGLLKSRQKQVSFKKFNPEQQGNIVQTYYVRRRAGKDLSAWQPYIDELQKWV
jgi:hypothetical protein